MVTPTALAPPWRTTEWLNTPGPLTLERLRGNVVLLHAFQMLCPGCVSRGIPQAQRACSVTGIRLDPNGVPKWPKRPAMAAPQCSQWPVSSRA